jgi:hypothetical protein
MVSSVSLHLNMMTPWTYDQMANKDASPAMCPVSIHLFPDGFAPFGKSADIKPKLLVAQQDAAIQLMENRVE